VRSALAVVFGVPGHDPAKVALAEHDQTSVTSSGSPETDPFRTSCLLDVIANRR
jgi:hypothetical protein